MTAHGPKPIQCGWTLCALLYGVVFVNQPLSRAQTPDSPDSSPLHDAKILTSRIQVSTHRLKQCQQLDNQLHSMLASLPQPSQEALTKASEEHDALQLYLGALEEAFDAFKATNAIGASSVAELEEQLAETEKKRDLLVKRQTEALSDGVTTNNTKGWRNLVKRSDLTPICIMLVKNRVVPMMQPFFETIAGYMTDPLSEKSIAVAKIYRVHDGESAANAIRSDGLLDSLLAKADPKTYCVVFRVCSDSIAAYHSVSQAVAKRGFAYLGIQRRMKTSSFHWKACKTAARRSKFSKSSTQM